MVSYQIKEAYLTEASQEGGCFAEMLESAEDAARLTNFCSKSLSCGDHLLTVALSSLS